MALALSMGMIRSRESEFGRASSGPTLALTGLGAGFVISAVITRLLSGTGVLLLMSLAASGIPPYRAARLDPMETLREQQRFYFGGKRSSCTSGTKHLDIARLLSSRLLFPYRIVLELPVTGGDRHFIQVDIS